MNTKRKGEKDMKIYMVMFDWSTDDCSDVEVELFQSYDRAHNRFKEIICNELIPDMSWASDAFDKNGNVKDGYIFDEYDGDERGDCWWNLTDKNNWNIHSFLDLKELEVK